MKRGLLLAMLAMVLAIPSWAEEKPDRDTAAVLNILKRQADAWNRGDLREFMAGYWNSPELSFYSGRDKRTGWQATYERFQQRYQTEGREMGRLTFTELIADRLSADRMMVRGRWRLDFKSESADGLFTLLVERKPEGWRIVHDHTSVGEQVKKMP